MGNRGDRGGPVAIIGMASRFPGAAEPAEFHDLTVAGRRMFRPVADGLRAALLDDWARPEAGWRDTGPVQKLAAETTALAVAGGAELGLDPAWLTAQARAGTLGRDEMRVYAADPSGLLPGEGCGVVVLARSADARAAGLPVYAEIAGWSTVPVSSSALDSQAMLRAYLQGGIDPTDIQLIEGEGTGITAGAETAQTLAAADRLHIADSEGARSPVLAGSTAGIRSLTRRARAAGVAVEVLGITHAPHSPAMARCAAPLRTVFAGTCFAPPRRRLISTVTGRPVMPGDDLAELLAGQLSRPVLFGPAMALAAGHADLIVTAGPDDGLTELAAACCAVPSVAVPAAATARAVAALFAAGAIDDVRAVAGGGGATADGGAAPSAEGPGAAADGSGAAPGASSGAAAGASSGAAAGASGWTVPRMRDGDVTGPRTTVRSV